MLGRAKNFSFIKFLKIIKEDLSNNLTRPILVYNSAFKKKFIEENINNIENVFEKNSNLLTFASLCQNYVDNFTREMTSVVGLLAHSNFFALPQNLTNIYLNQSLNIKEHNLLIKLKANYEYCSIYLMQPPSAEFLVGYKKTFKNIFPVFNFSKKIEQPKIIITLYKLSNSSPAKLLYYQNLYDKTNVNNERSSHKIFLAKSIIRNYWLEKNKYMQITWKPLIIPNFPNNVFALIAGILSCYGFIGNGFCSLIGISLTLNDIISLIALMVCLKVTTLDKLNNLIRFLNNDFIFSQSSIHTMNSLCKEETIQNTNLPKTLSQHVGIIGLLKNLARDQLLKECLLFYGAVYKLTISSPKKFIQEDTISPKFYIDEGELYISQGAAEEFVENWINSAATDRKRKAQINDKEVELEEQEKIEFDSGKFAADFLATNLGILRMITKTNATSKDAINYYRALPIDDAIRILSIKNFESKQESLN